MLSGRKMLRLCHINSERVASHEGRRQASTKTKDTSHIIKKNLTTHRVRSFTKGWYVKVLRDVCRSALSKHLNVTSPALPVNQESLSFPLAGSLFSTRALKINRCCVVGALPFVMSQGGHWYLEEKPLLNRLPSPCFCIGHSSKTFGRRNNKVMKNLN